MTTIIMSGTALVITVMAVIPEDVKYSTVSYDSVCDGLCRAGACRLCGQVQEAEGPDKERAAD